MPTLRMLAVVALFATQLRAAEPVANIEFFEAKIRPVLVEQCYSCHNSAKTAKGGLALDDRASLLKGGTEGVIVIAGKPEKSRLIAVLKHELDGKAMPKNGPKLDKGAIADFEKWIALGMPDPRDKPPTAEELTKATSWESILETRKKWWSFQPIRNPAPPESAWSKHPVDRFIAAKLAEKKLDPGAPADSATLIRRLYFTMIGLPPLPAEMERWTPKLKIEGGYDELVEHLLASPHFGEQWARHWMDWTRYADSHGSEGDPDIAGSWHYRDYLIRALNADVPYDQLVREHVAGDLLKAPRIDKKLELNESSIGPAHWRMVFHGYAPTDALEEKVRFIDDQINTFSKAFLGLTVSCARCHDHKFDAISHKDYYALFGVLASNRPGRIAIDSPEKLTKNKAELEKLKPAIRSAIAESWLASANALEASLLDANGPVKRADKPTSLLHPLFQLRAAEGDKAKFLDAGNRLVVDDAKSKNARDEFVRARSSQRWQLGNETAAATWLRQGTGLPSKKTQAGEFAVALTGERALAGIYPAGIYSHGLSTKHAARLESPSFKLAAESELWVRIAGEGGASLRYVVQDYPRDGTVFPVVRLNPQWHWQKFDLTYWTGDDIHIELAGAQDAPLMVNGSPRSWFGIREAVLLRKGSKGPPELREYLNPIYAALQKDEPKSSAAFTLQYVGAIMEAVKAWQSSSLDDSQAALLEKCLEEGLLTNKLAEMKTAKPLIEEYRKLEAEIAVPTRVPGLMEGVVRNQPLLDRGDHKRPKAEVPRRFLEAIDPTPYKGVGSGRLQLAEDLLSDKNPLTKRVIVNRLWHHAFGRGIVPTPDNFGRLGIEPTHPELLDYLATRFVEKDWSVKEMLRFLVMSKTWQLASKPTAEARRIDPDNLAFSHAILRRMEAESIRDSLLAVSGYLNRDLYGAPVGGNSDRRSIYVRVQRTALDPFLRSFDFPEPFSTVGRRDVTNVPAQSLTLMNDPRVNALAGNWAGRILADPKLTRDEDRIRRMMEAALGRPATAVEIETFRDYLIELKLNRGVVVARSAALRERLDSEQKFLRDVIDPVRAKLQLDAKDNPIVDEKTIPKAIAKWEFQDSLKDTVGSLHGESVNEAKLQNGALKVGGPAHVVTAPLAKTIREKTLEVWVQLDTLDQAGGAAMTIQTKDGGLFDAIVFGEKDPGQWVPGSNFFQRTQSLQASKETEAVQRVVHLAITYAPTGQIVAYRDGLPYGTGYKATGPLEFKAGEAVIGFGIRHSPVGGNKVLAGRIVRARLYDKALSADEVRSSANAVSGSIPESKVLEALTTDERAKVLATKKSIAVLEVEMKALGPVPAADDRAVWTDVARAIFGFKEFIYIK